MKEKRMDRFEEFTDVAAWFVLAIVLLLLLLSGCQAGPQTPVEKDPWDKPLKEQTDAELQESLRHWNLEIRKDVAHFDAVGRRPVRSEGQAKLQDLGMDAAALIQEAHESWKAGVEAEIALRKTKKTGVRKVRTPE